MNKERAINLLRSIQNDFLHSLDDGEFDNADDISAGALESNRECIEALDMAIKALKK